MKHSVQQKNCKNNVRNACISEHRKHGIGHATILATTTKIIMKQIGIYRVRQNKVAPNIFLQFSQQLLGI